MHKAGNIKHSNSYKGINSMNSGYKFTTSIIKNKLCTYFKNKPEKRTEKVHNTNNRIKTASNVYTCTRNAIPSINITEYNAYNNEEKPKM
jgi:hypothetical protein